MTEPLVFEPSARLQRLLSQELISDPNLAVIELVKNGYDAGASKVKVDLKRGNGLISESQLVVWDNGSGMSEQEFRSYWMRPGFSEKARTPGATIPVGRGHRVPVGEKGLGRLAAGRLGDQLTIYTRKNGDSDWFSLFVDWTDFEDMDLDLREVKLTGNRVPTTPVRGLEFGTVLVIDQMTVDLAAQIPGRRSSSRPMNRFGRLSQDLRLLTATSSGGNASNTAPFQIVLSVDRANLQDYAGAFTGYTGLADGQFSYAFEVTASASGRLIVSRRARRGETTLNAASDILNVQGPIRELGEQDKFKHPVELLSGPFRGIFVYAPPASGQHIKSSDPSGVFLYRDGVRVEPYGEPGADWLGIASRRASRQAHVPIRPGFLFGHIEISRTQNSRLQDMTNRQGLIENEAFENLVEHAQAEFAVFEQIVEEESAAPRREANRSRTRQAAAKDRVAITKAQSRSLAHSVRQPLAGVGAYLTALENIAEDERIPAEVRKQLKEIRESLGAAAEDVSDRVQAFLTANEEEVTDFNLITLLGEVAKRVVPVNNPNRASIEIFSDVDNVAFARPVLVEALAELATNALSAPEVEGRRRVVTLSAEETDTAVVVTVSDNGPGLPEARRKRTFERGQSTSGRPGQGLVTQRLTVVGAGAELTLDKSDDSGAEFSITIPRSLQTLKID